MKKIIEYVPIITVCLIYFGFCNLHYYYKEFNIDIYHYVSNTEILLSFLPTIVVLASTLYTFAYSRIINPQSNHKKNIEKNNKEIIEEKEIVIPKKKNKILRFLTTLPGQIILLFVIMSTIHLILTELFGYKPYELQDLNIIDTCILLAIIYFSSHIFKNQEIINNNILLIIVFSVIYFGIQISIYRKLDADKIKDGISIKEIEFQYNDKKIATSTILIYIGQTQSNLFLYNKKDKSTSVYKTEKIDSLVIKNVQ
jgi:hypothetical protein